MLLCGIPTETGRAIGAMNTESTSVHRSTLSILSVTAAAVLALAACSPDEPLTSEDDTDQVEDTPTPETEDETDNEDTTDTETPEQEPTEDETTDEAESPEASGEHPVYQAIEAATAEYPDGVITDFDDESHENGYIEITVIDGDTEWELHIDTENDFAIDNTQEEPADADDVAEAEAVEVDIIEALQTAEDEADAEPYEGSLDTEAGTVVWEFEMSNNLDVYVDVATGEVVGTDQ